MESKDLTNDFIKINKLPERFKFNSYNSYAKSRIKNCKRFSKSSFIIIRKNIFIFIILVTFLILFYIIKHIYKIFNYSFKKEKFFFFEKNQDELEFCKNYGLMVYNYYFDRKTPNEEAANIGDYIQSLAALQYLPKNCKPYLIDRDKVQFYNGKKIKLIMAGWHCRLNGTLYISSKIDPIFTSYHFNDLTNLPSVYVENMKKFAPIGCRDYETRDVFIKYGINSYFTGCLTTTLDIDYAADEKERTNEIIFVDYKFGENFRADRFISSLKAYNFSNITYLDHHFKLNLTYVERFQLTKKLLDKYARAKLVITTRLHAALPCLAFNTPVILINKRFDNERFKGLYELLNTVGYNQQHRFEIRVNIDDKGFVYNSKKYLEYALKMKEYLKNV